MRGAAAVFGVLAACLLIVAQLANSLHFALVPHHLCLEHGRFEHEDDRRPSAHTGNARVNGAAVQSADDDEHDECKLLARRGEHLAVTPASSLEALRLSITVHRVAVPVAPVPPVSAVLLLFAPKQGPPV